MRFVVDECTGPSVARWLREQGHDVVSIFDDAAGTDDDAILKLAYEEERVLITNDKDFGDKVFRDGLLHHGIILLRLNDERPAVKLEVLERLLATSMNNIVDNFVVATENQIRFARSPRKD